MKTSNILLTVALIAIAGFGVSPIRKMTHEKVVKNKQLFIKKKAQIERVNDLKNAEKTENNERVIPSSPQQMALIDDVDRIARKTGFSLPDAWSFSIGRNSDVNAEQISISFPLSGRRKQIQNFLQEVENNPRFMGVRGFSFTTDATQAIPRTEMSIALYAFFVEA
jgi:hypothetical protein